MPLFSDTSAFSLAGFLNSIQCLKGREGGIFGAGSIGRESPGASRCCFISLYMPTAPCPRSETPKHVRMQAALVLVMICLPSGGTVHVRRTEAALVASKKWC